MTIYKHKLSVSTPGRICLFGEHQDYLGLPVIACAISLRINIEGQFSDDDIVTIDLPDINDKEIFSIHDTFPYQKERDYFRSSVNVLKRHGFRFSKGLNCRVEGHIPINSGTSSSSALVVSWINFLARMSEQKVTLEPAQIAEYAYEAEVLEFSEPGGMMDQYSTSIGGIIMLDSFPEIKIEKANVSLGQFVLGDSCESKDTKAILSRVKVPVLEMSRQLRQKYPDFSLQTVELNDLTKYAGQLQKKQIELLQGTLQNRDITNEAKKILLNNQLNNNEIGHLLNEHQKILAGILKISTPKIDKMIDAAMNAGALGAKINGSGGGGCMFAYAPDNTQDVKNAIEKEGGKAYIIKADEGTKFDIS